MQSILKTVLPFLYLINTIWCGISVPKDHCTWLREQYGSEMKCDGDQVIGMI